MDCFIEGPCSVAIPTVGTVHSNGTIALDIHGLSLSCTAPIFKEHEASCRINIGGFSTYPAEKAQKMLASMGKQGYSEDFVKDKIAKLADTLATKGLSDYQNWHVALQVLPHSFKTYDACIQKQAQATVGDAQQRMCAAEMI